MFDQQSFNIADPIDINAEKARILPLAKAVKQILCQNDDYILLNWLEEALDGITESIQYKLNEGSLSDHELTRLAGDFKSIAPHFLEDKFKLYTKCCIFLAKHDTESRIVENRYGRTNTTSAIDGLLETCVRTPKEVTETRLFNRLFALQTIKADAANHLLKSGPFSFKYKTESVDERHLEESKKAEEILFKNDNIQKTVSDVSKRTWKLVVSLFEAHPDNRNLHFNIIANIAFKMHQLAFDGYPILEDLVLKAGKFNEEDASVYAVKLQTYLESEETSTLQKLSITWVVGAILTHKMEKTPEDHLYTQVIQPSKSKAIATSSARCHHFWGNTRGEKRIETNAFEIDGFTKFAPGPDFWGSAETVQDLLAYCFATSKTPYVCGLSGIANVTSKLLRKLHIPLDSKLGQEFAEATSAFVVATGMHTYTEAYTSFNLSHEINSGTDMTGTLEEVRKSITPYNDLVALQKAPAAPTSVSSTSVSEDNEVKVET